MDANRCPACGVKGYWGNRCRTCLYTPFGEQIAHRNHYHQGEPLVLKTPPKATRPGRGCDSYSGKRMPTVPKWVWILLAVLVGLPIVLALLEVLPGLGGLIACLSAWSILKKKRKKE